MSAHTKSTGAALAVAAAVLFAQLPLSTVHAEQAKMKCVGANACKGQSACATPKNACQGQNSCKGTGYLMLTKAECDAALAKMKAEKK